MTSEQPSLPASGEMATVTYRDDAGHSVVFHGRMSEQYKALTLGDSRGEFRHHPHRGTTAARRWAAVEHAIEHTQIPRRAWRGRDFEYDATGLMVCIDSETVTIAPLTEEGRAWLAAHESAAEKRDRLLARFAALDPEAAAELEAVIADLVTEARDEVETRLMFEDD